MSNTLQGKIIKVFEKQTFDSGFTKREFVIDTGGEYPQHVKFELLKDNSDKLTESDVDRHVTVYFDLRGREWQGKYFNNAIAWKLEMNSPGIKGSGEPPTKEADGDDMPF